MTDYTATLAKALGEAGAILMKHYGRLESFEKKGEIDLVTVADRESEECIKRIILGAHPGDDILAEESGATAGTGGSGARWIIDPLDGTTNFAHSFPMFSVSIAVERDGHIIAAGVEAPFMEERFLAERGAGATLNGASIRRSKVQSLADSLLVTGFPYDRRERGRHYLAIWGDLMNRVHGILRLGSAALDMCSVASGRLEGFWEEKLHPWDTAAGWLIVEEAGGTVSDFTGAPFSPFGRQTLATNGLIHDEIVAILRPYAG